MSFEDEVRSEIGDALSAHSGIPLARSMPMAGDDDHASRLVAVEKNVDRLERAIWMIVRKLDAES